MHICVFISSVYSFHRYCKWSCNISGGISVHRDFSTTTTNTLCLVKRIRVPHFDIFNFQINKYTIKKTAHNTLP